MFTYTNNEQLIIELKKLMLDERITQQQIADNARREESLQRLSDAQIQTIMAGTDTSAGAVAKRNAVAREQARRASLNSEQQQAENAMRDRQRDAIVAIANNKDLNIEQKREEVAKLRGESQTAAVRRQIDYQTRERQQQAEAQRQQAEAQAEAQRQQEGNVRRHEEDAMRRGKTNISIPNIQAGILNGGPTTITIQGYAAPSDFNQGGAWSTDANGDHIYTEGGTGGRKWNANTGRYVKPQSPPPNNP